MDKTDWIEFLMLLWSNVIATIALVHEIRSKKKTAPRKPRKHKKKR